MKKLTFLLLILIFSFCTKNENIEPNQLIINDTIYIFDTLIIPIDSTLYDVVFESYCQDPNFYKKWDVIIKVHNDLLYFNEVSAITYYTKAFKNDHCDLIMDSIHSWGYYGMRIIVNSEIKADTFFETPGWAEKVKISYVIK